MTSALAMPPMKRRAANETIADGAAIAVVDAALIANAVRSQNLGRAATSAWPANRAPMK